MTCKYCGQEIADGAKFCENCGNKIEAETVSATATDETVNAFKEPERVEADIVSEAPKMEESASSASAETGAASTAAPSDMGPIGFSIASLVCGILGLLCCCCGFFGLVLSAAGIALGIVSLNKNCEGKGMAIAGIVCGGIGAFIVLIGMAASGLSDKIGLNNVIEDNLGIDDITDFLDSL